MLNSNGGKYNQPQQEKFEDAKGVIRSRKSKKERHHIDKKNDKMTNSDLQNITQEIKDRAARTPLKTGGELRCPGRVCSSTQTISQEILKLRTTTEWVFVLPLYKLRYLLRKA